MVFLGPEVFNGIADKLERIPLLPVIEFGLLLVFLLHVVKAIEMVLANRQARPIAYVRKKYAGAPSRKEPRIVDDDPVGTVAGRSSS